MASETNADWTAWAIGALGTMAAAVVALGKIIMGISNKRIAQLEEQLDAYVKFADNRAQEMKTAHEDCIERHHQSEIRLKVLEALASHQHPKNNEKENEQADRRI